MIRTIDYIEVTLERERDTISEGTSESSNVTQKEGNEAEREEEIKQESRVKIEECDFTIEDVMILEEIFVEMPKLNKKPMSKLPIHHTVMTLWDETRNISLGREEEKHAIIGSKQFITQNEASTSTSDNQKDDLVILKYSEEFDSVDNFIPPPGYNVVGQLMEVTDLLGEDSLSDADKQDISGEYFETGEWLETPFQCSNCSEVSELMNAHKDIITKIALTLGDLRDKYGNAFIKALQSISESVCLQKDILNYIKNAIDCLEDAEHTNYALKRQTEMATYSFDTQLLGIKSESEPENMRETSIKHALDEIESIIKAKVIRRKCTKCVRILNSDDVLESNLIIVESESDADEDRLTRKQKRQNVCV